MGYLLDTNIVSAILKRDSRIIEKLEDVGLKGQEVFISSITYYEIKRGLFYVNASRKISDFDQLCNRVRISFLDDLEIIETAAEIHADLTKRGMPLPDADILIAATAITRNLILVSNDSDMLRVPGITLENWMNLES